MFKPNPKVPKATPKIPRVSPPQTPGEQAVEAILAKAHELNLGLAQPESLLIQQTPPPRNEGYWQHFERGWVYWSPKTGAHMVTQYIFSKWGEYQWEQGFLGFPKSDETITMDRHGRYNHFEGGSIYYTPRGGIFEVHGAIRDKWVEFGSEKGFLGY